MYKHRYHINVFYSEEDRCFIADAPDLKYCSAHGSTPEKAVKEIQTAIELCVEVARDTGRPVPEPRYWPLIYQPVFTRPAGLSASSRRRSTLATKPRKAGLVKPKRAAAA
jgi:predicted RNase H-like HicB family nuclease